MQPMEEELEKALDKRRKEKFRRIADMIGKSITQECNELTITDPTVRHDIVDLVLTGETVNRWVFIIFVCINSHQMLVLIFFLIETHSLITFSFLRNKSLV